MGVQLRGRGRGVQGVCRQTRRRGHISGHLSDVRLQLSGGVRLGAHERVGSRGELKGLSGP